MEACVDQVRYRDWGASDLAMRTFLEPRIVELFGREPLPATPAVVEQLPWGGIRIDLVPEPWTASKETLVEARTRAMSHLAPAKVFATGRVHANGAVQLVRCERFPREWMDG